MSVPRHLSSVNGLNAGLKEIDFLPPPELSLSTAAAGPPMEKEPAGGSPVGLEALSPALKASSVQGRAKLCARGHWRSAEDAKLKELVTKFGPQNWNLIAEHLDGRSGKSCRLRWFNQLDPRINKKAFTDEEEEKLLAAHRLYGNKWAMIARMFPGRTDNAVKNHWHVVMARRKREQQHPGSTHRKRANKPDSPSAGGQDGNRDCSDSTVTSNVDELGGGSTCTGLSLTPSSAKGPLLTLSCSYSGAPVSNEANSKVMENVSPDKSPAGPVAATVMELDHSGCSNSEVSASDSITNTSVLEEIGSYRKKMNVPLFINFLGVGAN